MDFFPKGKRPILESMNRKLEILREKADQVVEKGLNIPDFEKRLDRVVNTAVEEFFGKIDSQFPIESET